VKQVPHALLTPSFVFKVSWETSVEVQRREYFGLVLMPIVSSTAPRQNCVDGIAGLLRGK